MMELITVVLLLAVSNLAHAAGAEGGGGGSRITAFFAERGKAILDKLEKENVSDINVVALRQVLSNVDLVATDLLKMPGTNSPILDQEALIAYGSPGLIQLKRKDWIDAIDNKINMDHQVLHEICRASRGICEDEGYRISILRLGLGVGTGTKPSASSGFVVKNNWVWEKTAQQSFEIAINTKDSEDGSFTAREAIQECSDKAAQMGREYMKEYCALNEVNCESLDADINPNKFYVDYWGPIANIPLSDAKVKSEGLFDRHYFAQCSQRVTYAGYRKVKRMESLLVTSSTEPYANISGCNSVLRLLEVKNLNQCTENGFSHAKTLGFSCTGKSGHLVSECSLRAEQGQ